MVTPFPSYSQQLSTPARAYEPVTKADANLPSGDCRAILVGAAGTLNLMDLDGIVRTGVPVQAGFNPIMARQIRSGGTADNVWAIY